MQFFLKSLYMQSLVVLVLITINSQNNTVTKITLICTIPNKNSVIPPAGISQNLISSYCIYHFLSVFSNQMPKRWFKVTDFNRKLSFTNAIVQNDKPSSMKRHFWAEWNKIMKKRELTKSMKHLFLKYPFFLALN